MKLVLTYSHYDQLYVGGLLKRAAKRLGIDVISVGPKIGSWTPAPKEEDSDPDVETGSGSVDLSTYGVLRNGDALVTVDQSTGFLPHSTTMPHAVVQTESNDGELERARGIADPDALWSLMPMKPTARYTPGLLHLEWGYDQIHTPLTDPMLLPRGVDFSLRGTPNDYRIKLQKAFDEKLPHVKATFGTCTTRQVWGDELCCSKITLCDHDEDFLSGRVVDAMAAGCLVLAKPSPSMDMLAPGGYVPIRKGATDKWPDIGLVVGQVCYYLTETAERAKIVRRAQEFVARLTWDNQLLRILGSIGVRP